MNKEQRQADLLRKAEEAECRAHKSPDLSTRNAWAGLAANCRALADPSEEEPSTFTL